MSNLWDTERRSADALESIDKRLEDALNPAPSSAPPQCARMFSDTLKEFLEAVRSAKDIRQHAVKAAEPFKGSTGYDSLIEDANDKYNADVSNLREHTKGAVKAAIALFRDLYEKNTQRAIPSSVMQQLSIFSMLAHPSAAEYERYQRVFRDYPTAQEVLLSKYDADMEQTGDGKPGYVPKFGSGVAFTPYRPKDANAVQNSLDMLLNNAYGLIDGACIDHPGVVAAAQVRKAEQATNPVQMISAVNVDDDSNSEQLLSVIDYEYRPSTKEKSPEDTAAAQYARYKVRSDIIAEGERQSERTAKSGLDAYIKG